MDGPHVAFPVNRYSIHEHVGTRTCIWPGGKTAVPYAFITQSNNRWHENYLWNVKSEMSTPINIKTVTTLQTLIVVVSWSEKREPIRSNGVLKKRTKTIKKNTSPSDMAEYSIFITTQANKSRIKMRGNTIKRVIVVI